MCTPHVSILTVVQVEKAGGANHGQQCEINNYNFKPK